MRDSSPAILCRRRGQTTTMVVGVEPGAEPELRSSRMFLEKKNVSLNLTWYYAVFLPNRKMKGREEICNFSMRLKQIKHSNDHIKGKQVRKGTGGEHPGKHCYGSPAMAGLVGPYQRQRNLIKTW